MCKHLRRILHIFQTILKRDEKLGVEEGKEKGRKKQCFHIEKVQMEDYRSNIKQLADNFKDKEGRQRNWTQNHKVDFNCTWNKDAVGCYLTAEVLKISKYRWEDSNRWCY